MAVGAIVAVLSTHLLVPIARQASAGPRLLALVFSIGCASFVMCLHARYYMSVQAEAGERRMAAVASSDVDGGGHTWKPRRGASQILAEVADVKADQVRLRSRTCVTDCSRLDAREAVLRARIAALDAEADEVRQWQQDQERLEIRKAAVKDDPVIDRLAGLLGVTSGAMGLTIGVLFAVILEGTGCLCWFLVLQRSDLTAAGSVPTKINAPVTEMPLVTMASPTVMSPVTTKVAASTNPGDQLREPDPPVGGGIESKQGRVFLLVDRVRPEIEAGRVKPTVTDIREYLECARSTAAEVRRVLNAGDWSVT